MPENPNLLDLQFIRTEGGTEITLRDLFAAAALSGLTANCYISPRCGPMPEMEDEVFAKLAYSHADAMLAARGRREEKG